MERRGVVQSIFGSAVGSTMLGQRLLNDSSGGLQDDDRDYIKGESFELTSRQYERAIYYYAERDVRRETGRVDKTLSPTLKVTARKQKNILRFRALHFIPGRHHSSANLRQLVLTT